jgi:hypothetical protein
MPLRRPKPQPGWRRRWTTTRSALGIVPAVQPGDLEPARRWRGVNSLRLAVPAQWLHRRQLVVANCMPHALAPLF